MSIADAEEVELLLDGTPLDRVVVGAPRPLIARFETEYRRGTLTAVAYVGGVETARTSLRTAGDPVLREESETIATDGLGYVEITIADADGTLLCDEDRVVRVSVSGGSLAGIGSARARTEESFAGPSVTTFDGRALAIVRPDASAEQIRVTVMAEGLVPSHAVIGVR